MAGSVKPLSSAVVKPRKAARTHAWCRRPATNSSGGPPIPYFVSILMVTHDLAAPRPPGRLAPAGRGQGRPGAQPSPCALPISPMAAGGASRTSAFAIIMVAVGAAAGRRLSAAAGFWPALAVKSSLLLPSTFLFADL
eukprot:COSAG01_NODE_1487_length_10136_cov_8.813390_10_plen_138_part_00